MGVKKTHQQFLGEISDKGIQVEVLEEYINSQTPLSCKCKKCGLIWKIRPNNLLRGYGCPSCAGQYRRTSDEFVRDLNAVNPNIILLGSYVDTQTKTDFLCKLCNYKWSTTPANLLSGRGCPECGIKMRTAKLTRTPEEYESRIKELHPNIILLSKYKNSTTKVTCRCKICSYEWNAVAQSLIQGTGCPKCSGKMKKTDEEFKIEILKKHPKIELLSAYINAKTKVTCRCKICDYKWDAYPSTLQNGKGCPKCNKVHIRSKDEFITDLYAFNPNVKVIGEYKNTQTKVECECLVCNHKWLVLPSKLLSGRGCPKCAREKRGDALRKSHQQFVAEMAEVNNSIIILGEYRAQNINILCSCEACGHQWSVLPNNLLRGQGCPECGKKAIGDTLRKAHDQFVSELRSISSRIEIISKYQGDSQKVTCKCIECGHIWDASQSNLLKGSGCPACAHIQTSFVERSIFVFLQHALGKDKVLSRDRSAIGKELDIYIPDAQLAIEPGSWYWHKDKVKRDLEKQRLCENNGIRLITIYDSFDGNRSAFDFDSDVITLQHNLGELSYRDELDSLIQNLLKQLNVQVYFSDTDKETLYAEAKEAASRKSTQNFIDELFAVNPNIELLGRYQGDKEKTLCLCKICGHEWSSDYEHLVRRKQGCPNCNSSKKAVINLTTGKIYESASAAARHLGVSINAVGMVCRGKAKTCKGDQWCYVENLSDEEKRHYNLLKT